MLRRHLRYAATDPRKLWWIVRRALDIVRQGKLSGVLDRHRLADDLYRDYPAWIAVERKRAQERVALYARERERWPATPRFSILMPVYAPAMAHLEQAIASVRSQHYAAWELCVVDDASPSAAAWDRLQVLAADEARMRLQRRGTNAGIAAATNDALALASGEWCVFLDQDDMLAPETLLEFAARIAERPQAVMLYGDEDRIDEGGQRHKPFFKPDFDPEWLRTTNYILHPVAVRTDFLRALDGLRTGIDGAQDWDLMLRAAERAAAGAIEHVPHVLYHWREHAGSTAAGVYEKTGVVGAQERVLRDSLLRRGEDASIAQVGGAWRLCYRMPADPPLASIVVPTRNRADLLARCIAGLRERTAYSHWQCVLVDNGSDEPAALELLRSLGNDPRFVVRQEPGAFNYSRLCNLGVAASAGSVVVLLNNDVEPLDDDWLRELITHALRPSIGLVGALLYYPDRTIQHAGVVLGLNGVADRPYIGRPRGFQGVDSRLLAVHTVTAMITACAAVRRATYDAVGGMDEMLPVNCNDLDLCLRVADAGLRNILTPHAELLHHESASRGYHYATVLSAQETADEERFKARWSARLAHDPAYNPNLTRAGAAYGLAIGAPP